MTVDTSNAAVHPTGALFREVFEHSINGMLVLRPTDDGLVVVAANQAAATLLGSRPDDLVGRPWAGLSGPDLEMVDAAVADLLSGRSTRWQREVRLVVGGSAWVVLSLSRLRSGGEPTVLAQLQDRTAGRRAETMLRDAQLKEREAVERLLALDRAKSDFICSVSHELRTPITSVLGYTEILQAGEAGELDLRQSQLLDRVARNGQRLLTLVEDLLTLSTVESGEFRIDETDVNLPTVVRRSLGAVEPALAGRRLRMAVTVSPVDLKVVGDADQLQRAVVNLVSNAIKFTPDGGGIAVDVGREGDACVVRVEDTGAGIPADEQTHVFDRFYRTAHAHRRAIPGTGLGLSIVRSIASSHGGSVALVSEPGRGTTVTLRLPAAPVHVAG